MADHRNDEWQRLAPKLDRILCASEAADPVQVAADFGDVPRDLAQALLRAALVERALEISDDAVDAMLADPEGFAQALAEDRRARGIEGNVT